MGVKRSQSAARVLTVLEGVAVRQPVGVSALPRRLEMDKSAVQRSLMTLADDGWIRPVPGAQWELTPRSLAMAKMPHSIQALRHRARAALEALRGSLGETVFLTVPDVRRFVIVEALESGHLLRMVPPVGMVVPTRASATGQAVLAWCSDARRAELLDGAPDESLLASWSACRTRGFAISDGEIDPGSVSFAAPVFAGAGDPIGAIVVSGPKGRLTAARYGEVGALVAHAAGGLSLELAERT